MPHVKFFGPTVQCFIDDNFDSPQRKKSIAKKAENEIVLSSTRAKLSMAERPQSTYGSAQKKRDHRPTK